MNLGVKSQGDFGAGTQAGGQVRLDKYLVKKR